MVIKDPRFELHSILCLILTDAVLLKRTAAIFSRQASLTRQAFLITPLHGTRYKTGKNAYAKK